MTLLGDAWHYKKCSKVERLALEETDARTKWLRIWSRDDATPPWDWRNGIRTYAETPLPDIKHLALATTPPMALFPSALGVGGTDPVVYITDTGLKCHWQDCRTVKNGPQLCH